MRGVHRVKANLNLVATRVEDCAHPRPAVLPRSTKHYVYSFKPRYADRSAARVRRAGDDHRPRRGLFTAATADRRRSVLYLRRGGLRCPGRTHRWDGFAQSRPTRLTEPHDA